MRKLIIFFLFITAAAFAQDNPKMNGIKLQLSESIMNDGIEVTDCSISRDNSILNFITNRELPPNCLIILIDKDGNKFYKSYIEKKGDNLGLFGKNKSYFYFFKTDEIDLRLSPVIKILKDGEILY